MSDVSNSLDAFTRWTRTIERRIRSLELGAELMAESTTEAVHRLDERIEKLEAPKVEANDRGHLAWGDEAYHANVKALVKAARDAYDFLKRQGFDTRLIGDALKPFEAP